jgi:hypothetical protein
VADNNRFSRPVAFNKKNERDQKRLKHIGRKAFSTYVKKLIDEDMMKTESAPKFEKKNTSPQIYPEKSLTAAEKLEQLKKRGGSAQKF